MPKGVSIISTIFLGIIIIIGLLNAVNPRMMWKAFESWKATAEPSTAYFLSRRIGGIVAVSIVLLIIIVPYIMNKQ